MKRTTIQGKAITSRPDLEVVTVPVDALTLDPRNARKHGKRNLDAIKASLPEFGQRRPLVVMGDMTVIAGNGTLEAARSLGWTEVAVTVVPAEWTPEQAAAYALADNRTAELAVWDEDALLETLTDLDLAGWDVSLLGFEAADVPSVAAAVVEDEAPEPPSEPITKPGDLWLLGEHRVLCGDSTKAETFTALTGGASAEMLWTDPPYGVAIGDKNKMLNAIGRSNRVEQNLINDTLDEDGLSAFVRSAFAGAATACLAGAAWYVAAPPGPLHVIFGAALKDLGIWRQTIQWVKNNATFSPMGVDYHWRAEPIFYGWLPNAGHRYYGGRKQDTVWEIDRPTKSPDHPTMKPVALVARAIENSSKKGEVVLDPFLGSGTTLIAAEQLGRICYGVELDPAYCDVIVKRWENLTGREAVLVRGKG